MGSKMAVEDKKFNGGSAGDGWENGGTKGRASPTLHIPYFHLLIILLCTFILKFAADYYAYFPVLCCRFANSQ